MNQSRRGKQGKSSMSKKAHFGMAHLDYPGSFSIEEQAHGERTPYFNSGTSSGNGLFKSASTEEESVSSQQESNLYPGWEPEASVPITQVEIEAILTRLQSVFGFQEDNVKNISSYLMMLLDSRASRMGPGLALRSIHGDYIGGPNANFRKWYFAAEMDLDDIPRRYEHSSKSSRRRATEILEDAQVKWHTKMSRTSPEEQVTHIALYLLCWGEANNVRFMPECICFIVKCCLDYYNSVLESSAVVTSRKPFLDHVITPLYNTLRDQSFTLIHGKLERVDKDHDKLIGYDDINQLFWHRSGLQRLLLPAKYSIMELSKEERYHALGDIKWNKSFFKTYREKRTWMHVLLNFGRVINIHSAMFWYFTSFHAYPLYTKDYEVAFDTQPPVQVRMSIMALGGGITSFSCLLACMLEMSFLSRKWEGTPPIFKRLFGLIILTAFNVGPTIALFAFGLDEYDDSLGITIASLQLACSVATIGYLCIESPLKLFGSHLKDRASYAARSFTSNFHELSSGAKMTSFGLWTIVLISKFMESYFFLTVPMRDPVRELSQMSAPCVGDQWFGAIPCSVQPVILLGLIFVLEYVLFFLDTYLWYIMWNTVFSVSRSVYNGTSIWTPWRSIFTRLPRRMYSKLMITNPDQGANITLLVSKLWNSIVISMYREHYLSIEQVQKLLYHSNGEKSEDIREPTFFIAHEDESSKSRILTHNSEAKRRISFFAQSLTASMPEIREVSSMPNFTVFIPHYSEKIILSLKEILKEEDKYSHITLLEYLKQLYPLEWMNFVRDTKMMAEENEPNETASVESKEDCDDIPYLTVGFKEATQVYIMRSRIWASLRTQTLYRTVFGFMNYSKAIKLLYDLETGCKHEGNDFDDDRFKDIHEVTFRKFQIVVAMQRYTSFTEEELECTETLLRAYPEVQIAYIDEHVDEEMGEITYYSCLIDGTCPLDDNNQRLPKYRIRLSGYPILGDGKSDNQNHALIFTRGEYIQLVDANQDNYLEECLKIRHVLSEFEEQSLPDPYAHEPNEYATKPPIAIIGTREYIFSENTGILGDIAAGKEQTFGTLFARTLAQLGGKLHYGHPDFLNSTFMTTRGGVSKAQKGLHLNEDIYAGMTALIRGGRIKHCEYTQCGKGRDLGFTSISNFITKIGAGMGEQNLSREYFYLGTQLPLDRVLSFYYAHAGFHFNNFFIILSIQLFTLTAVNLAALTSESVICEHRRYQAFTDPRTPANCVNLYPVIVWLERSILSIFLIFFMSLLPLAIHEMSERGVYRSITRIGKHLLSMSPLFEIFVCKMYSQSLINDISVGGAQYIATGRGFATKRQPFSDLYTRFGNESMKFGAFLLLMVIYFSVSMWDPVYLFFWFSVVGFIMSPFLFNPNQFIWAEYLVDYKNYVKWLNTGNSSSSTNSWTNHTKLGRIRLTGINQRVKYGEEEVKFTNTVRPSRYNLLTTVLTPQLATTMLIWTAFMFCNSQGDSRDSTHTTQMILFSSTFPIIINSVALLVLFFFSAALGPLCCSICRGFPALMAFTAHLVGIASHFSSFLLIWYIQNFELSKTILGICLCSMIQKLFLQGLNTLILSREMMDGRSNRAWWSGKWLAADLGWRILTQPLREYFCKVMELTYFAGDFFMGHFIFYIQIPILLVPFANTWHSMALMWLKPGTQLRRQFLPQRERQQHKLAVLRAAVIFLVFFLLIGTATTLPIVALWLKKDEISGIVPDFIADMRQPKIASEHRKGLYKGLFKGK